MFEICSKEQLNPSVARMVIHAPLVARKARPGQFIILRPFADSERIPLTISGYDREAGTITIIYQIVGRTTMELDRLQPGDCLQDFAGPLGTPSHLEGLKRVCVVGGGVGCAIALPVAQELARLGCEVHGIIGARTAGLLILEEEFRACCSQLRIMTDDGTRGEEGFVNAALEQMLQADSQYDCVFAIGPLVMMRSICRCTKEYGIKTIISMNPIMIDGTGMCGGCRLTVGGQTKFACVDGPDFDGHQVDFDEALSRGRIYQDFESQARETACNLFKKEAE